MAVLGDVRTFTLTVRVEPSVCVACTFRTVSGTQKAVNRFLSLLSYLGNIVRISSEEKREAQEKKREAYLVKREG